MLLKLGIYVTYDNGVFNGHLYVDLNGNILNFSPSNNNLKTAFDLGFGGSVLDLGAITNIYGDIASALNEQQFNYATSDIDLINNNISLLLSNIINIIPRYRSTTCSI